MADNRLRTTGLGFFLLLHQALGVVLAYSVGGWEAALFTVPFPIVAPTYWGLYVWGETGLSVLVVLVLAGTVAAGTAMLVISRSIGFRENTRAEARRRDAVVAPPAPPAPPRFAPFTGDEWERITAGVRGQIARGELQLERPTGADSSEIHPDRIWAIAHEAAPATHNVRELRRLADIPSERWPRIYLSRNDVDLSACWVAYLQPRGGPAMIGSSHIVIVRAIDGEVVYIGSAHDEG